MTTVRGGFGEPSLGLGDRYRILKQLGAGTSSVVFAAFDRELRRGVALKLLCPGYAFEALLEARAMGCVQHPNVIAIYDVGMVRDAAYLSMELVRGSTLFEWAQTPRSPKDILAVMAQAGRGLGAAHAAGIVHRDFKPANVLVDHHAVAKVCDFGLAGRAPRTIDRIEGRDRRAPAAHGRTGTDAYMAPEAALGHPIDPRSDQFSFAVTLYELLAGHRLFPTGNVAQTPPGYVEHHLELLRQRGASRRVHRLLSRALALHPDARYPTMAQLVADL